MADPTTFIATWFTPSSIFIIVNLVIGTIALASRFNGPPKNDQIQQQHPQLNRSPSLLNRIRSFNLRHYNQEPSFVAEPEVESESEFTQPQLVRKPSLLERVMSFNLNKHEPQYPQTHYVQPESESESTKPQLVRKPSLLQRVMSFNLNKHEPGQPEAENPSLNPVSDEVKSKVEMMKSASSKTFEREEEDEETVERRRPATAAARSETTTCKEDEAVDAKADDFINRFKKQLRLQRLDSFMRYRNNSL